MNSQEYIEDLSAALDVEDYKYANELINQARVDREVIPTDYERITKFAVNRGFKFGEHYQLLEV